jgi:hypothetical protein
MIITKYGDDKKAIRAESVNGSAFFKSTDYFSKNQIS